MSIRMLTDLGEALTFAGIPWTGIPATVYDPTGAADWSTRSRPASTGNFDPQGVLCHHTASPPSTTDRTDLQCILAGNSSAPGPISQMYIGRGGAVYLVAAGRANHGGKGIRPGVDHWCTDMNAALVGIEVGNSGVGEYWPDVQTVAYARTVAALCAHYGWTTDDVYLHATTGPPSGGCNSKIDPAGPWQRQPELVGSTTWNLDAWRAFVDEQTGGDRPQPQPPLGDDAMPAYINKGTDAVFAMTGGMCHWVPTSRDADALGVPPPDASGYRGTWVSDEFLRNLILVGAFPEPAGGLWAGHFRAWWPDGVPETAVVVESVSEAAIQAALAAP